MSEEVAVLMTVGLFAVLVLSQVPVGLAMLGSGVVGVIALRGPEVAASLLAANSYSTTARYALVVIPMYVLLGCLISNSGIGTQIYRSINYVVARLRLPGGLPATAILATSFFSGISGSSAADVAAFGRISVTEMTRHGYQKAYAAAVVAAAGTFAVLIPPSIGLVVYAIIAEQSIGAMILAGVVPGAVSALCLTAYVVTREAVRGRRTAREPVPVGAGAGAAGGTVEPPAREEETPREATRARRSDVLGLVYGAVLFVVVVGGLYGGFFTATEAGAMGALAALVITVLARRSSEQSLPRSLATSLRETVGTTSMIFLLMIGASYFTYLVASAGIAADVTRWAVGLDMPPELLVVFILLLLLVLGTAIDGLSILLLVTPIAAPIVIELGFDGIWFGVLCLKAIEIGLITPPVGLNVFIISGMTRQRAEKVFAAVVPFIVLDLVVTALFFLFPDLVLWLPRQAGLVG